MKTYPADFKNRIIAQMLPPHNRSIPELVKETGVPKDTLYTWRTKNGGIQANNGQSREVFTGSQKFQMILESATMNEHDLAEFCRRSGCFPEQVAAWREFCEIANDIHPRRAEQTERRELRKQNNQLQSELRRKEKALAEMAAILVLQKKVRAIWGEPEDASSNLSNDER